MMGRRAELRLPYRGTDRVEDMVAWLLTVVSVLGVYLAVAAGVDGYSGAMERGRTEAATRISTSATLTEDAPALVMANPGGGQAWPSMAAASWTAADGTPRTGEVPASAGGNAGSTVAIWTERDGSLAAAPASSFAAGLAAVLAAAAVLLLSGAMVAGAWLATRRATTTLNARSWEREWAAIEPQWRRNPR